MMTYIYDYRTTTEAPPRLQGKTAMRKDGFQIDQNRCDARHLLKEAHHH